MAKTEQFYKPIPAGEKLRLMALDALNALHINFYIQGIYPYEAYSGYLEKNAAAKRQSWRSSGAGFDSFYFQINDVANSWDVDVREATLEFFFNYYLKFLAMGVWKGRPIS